MKVNDKILFHPSSCGELMTEARSKTEILSETCKKRLVKVFVEEKYGREVELENKYIKKGLQTEEDAITLYSRIKKQVFFKNESYLVNDFLIGTPDFGDEKEISKSKVIIDTKSCWDLFTFWNAKTSDTNKAYYWQLQSYMALTGATKGIIAYCLINTPPALIYDECRKLQWKMGVSNPETDKDYIEACEKIEKNLTYDDIPMEERMFEVEIPRNDSDIERLYERIKQCREYMDKYLFAGQVRF